MAISASRNADVLLLTAPDVDALLTPARCLAAVEEAFLQHGKGSALPPVVCGVHVGEGGFHIKAGVIEGTSRRFVAKTNANFPANRRLGLPTIQGLVLLFDATDGRPLAILDSTRLTILRTAAATALAARHLARPDSSVLAVCGCGEQGRAHVIALRDVLALRKVIAFDTDADAAARLANLATSFGLEAITAEDVQSAVRACDVCVTCTPSKRWLFDAGDVRSGTFIAGVGADNPHKNELSPALLGTASVFVDVLEQCAEIGDLHHALIAGTMTRDGVRAELGEVVAGRKPGRTSEREITVFDSTGMALQDAASASVVFDLAMRAGRGVRCSFGALS